MQEQLVIPFFCPEIEKAGNRRRTRTVASSDAAITSRRDRLEKRNRIMTARYYYWTEIKRHTTKKYEEARVPLVECIPDVLKNPDEVWINDYQKKFDNLNFIKFYEDKVINVVCEVKNGTLYQVTTWFEIEQNANIKVKGRRSRKIDPRWRYRRGLLIKK